MRAWNWRSVLFGASVAMGVLETISAFIIEVPAAAIVAVVLFLAGAYWLSRGASKALVVSLGIFHLIELVFGISFLGKPAAETGGLGILVPVIAASALGLIAAVALFKELARGTHSQAIGVGAQENRNR